MSGLPSVKACSTCGREVFSTYRGDITIKPPARVERVDAAGNVVAVCRCGRRVVWFRDKKITRPTVTAG